MIIEASIIFKRIEFIRHGDLLGSKFKGVGSLFLI